LKFQALRASNCKGFDAFLEDKILPKSMYVLEEHFGNFNG